MPAEIKTLLMLHEARQRADTMLANLLRQAQELEQSPPDIPPGDLAAGQQAMDNAIAAARRMVQSLDDALKVGQNPPGKG